MNKNKNGLRADDLVKTPVSHDVGAPCCCNPPALLLSVRMFVARHWQGKRSRFVFFNVEYPDLCGTTRKLLEARTVQTERRELALC